MAVFLSNNFIIASSKDKYCHINIVVVAMSRRLQRIESLERNLPPPPVRESPSPETKEYPLPPPHLAVRCPAIDHSLFTPQSSLKKKKREKNVNVNVTQYMLIV